ncbi:CPBP family intramembrane glutamic endopeptidase [Methanobrevibacter sp.]|uniref:CPBP family intramembrane glutamic endopeptidase n=1 Tax=Methanobrevibacter sp. TaxID=66852 RepID=UPI00388D0D41
MKTIPEHTNEIPDYITFARKFENYRWYKPILTAAITGIFYLLFMLILIAGITAIYGPGMVEAVTGSYESLDDSNAITLISFLLIAILIPSLYIANRIVKDRPFSSYGSSLGGWRWKLYIKCLAIPLVVFIIAQILSYVTGSEDGSGISHLTPLAAILFLIIVPAQCIAEEYVYRGLLMQTLGSWIKVPIIAIIIQAILFGISHDYNSLGVFSIIVSGVVYGFVCWKTHGLEASSAIHTINNLFVAYMSAVGVSSTSSVAT